MTREIFHLTLPAAQDSERALADRLAEALSAMLTHMGMDEDEWNRVTFEQARAAVIAHSEARKETQ